MIKVLKKALIFLCFCSFFNCSTLKHTYRSSNLNKINVITNDVIVDVEIDLQKKITEESGARKTPKEAKEEAYYKAIENNNIDIVVDPIFEVSTTDKILFFGGKSKAKLTGFSGHYKNPRSKTSVINELNDIDTLNILKYDYIFGERLIKANNSNIVVLPTKNKKRITENKNITQNKNKAETFIPHQSMGVKLALANGNIINDEITNRGIALGLSMDFQAKEKLGIRYEFLFSKNSFSNNLNIPILLTYGKRLKFLLGFSSNINFTPKDEKLYENGFIDKEDYRAFVPTVGLGIDIGLSYEINDKITLESRSSIEIANASYTQNYIGLVYNLK